MYKCSICGINKTPMWRYDVDENVYCNACGIKQYRQVIKRKNGKEYKAEVARQFRRKVSINKLSAIIDKIRNEDQAKAIISILAKNCEDKVAEQLAAGEEVHVDISDVTKPCTFWKQLNAIVE